MILDVNRRCTDFFYLPFYFSLKLNFSSRTILEKYLKPAVSLAENQKDTKEMSRGRQSQTHFHLAHYADALFRSYEERLTSNEWQAAMRLRKHKVLENKLETRTQKLHEVLFREQFCVHVGFTDNGTGSTY